MPDTQEKEPTEAEVAEAERAQRARDQNLEGENAVPETRPQAMTVGQGPTRGRLAQQILDRGDPDGLVDPPDKEPMGQEAYDRAASDSQQTKASKNSQKEGLMVGSVGVATKGPYEGEWFAVTRIASEGSPADLIRRLGGRPEQVLNQPEEVDVTFMGGEMDGVRLTLNVEEHGLEKMNEDQRGSRGGRRH